MYDESISGTRIHGFSSALNKNVLTKVWMRGRPSQSAPITSLDYVTHRARPVDRPTQIGVLPILLISRPAFHTFAPSSLFYDLSLQ
jgi:hypothetical protein